MMKVLYFIFMEDEDWSNPLHKHTWEGTRTPNIGEMVVIKETRYVVKQIMTDFSNRRIQVYVE